MPKNNIFYVNEIFFSYQAEGIYFSTPTVFVRFSGCNLNCYYCDTLYSQKIFSAEKMSLPSLVKKIKEMITKYKPLHLSFTGGEPLLQDGLPLLLKSLYRENCLSINGQKIKVYLETNSSLPQKLKKIIKYIDIVAVNLKLPEEDIKKRNIIPECIKTIKICLQHKKIFFLKLVVLPKVYSQETLALLKRLLNNKINCIVLQPETNSYKNEVYKKRLFFNTAMLFQLFKEKVNHIYIIPQMHKILWNIR